MRRHMRTLVLATALLLTVSLAWGDDKVRNLIRENKLDQLKVLLAAKGFGINDDLGNGYSPLHFAVEANNADVVEFLVQNGADVNLDFHKTTTTISSNSGSTNVTATTFTPLALAVQKDLGAMAVRLIRSGASPDAVVDPKAFASKDEPFTVLKKAVDLNNSTTVVALLGAGVKIESAPGKADGPGLLDRSIDLWKANYIANRISLEAQSLTVAPGSSGTLQAAQGVVNLVGIIAGMNFSKYKVLESSNVLRALFVALKADSANSRRIREIFQPRKWDTLSALVQRSAGGEFQDRAIEVDLSLILGDYGKFQQAMADNAPLSAMTMVYLIQFDRLREFMFLQSLGLPYPYLLQTVSIDRESFPNYMVFAYSQGATGMLAYFQRLQGLAPLAAEVASMGPKTPSQP